MLDTDAEAVPGALLGRISTDGCPGEGRGPAKADTPADAAPPKRSGDSGLRRGRVETRLSPSVRRACLQHGIDPSRISGTGRNGRITREDVDRAVADATVVSVGEPATAQPRHFSAQDIPHDRMRLKIAENMVRAVSEAPHVTALFEADFSAIAAHKAAMAAKGVKLSYTAYIVKAAAEAMAVAPAINGRWEKDRIAISPTIDIGVGTALGEKGLVVPVVKDAGSADASKQIGARLDDLTRRARDGQARPLRTCRAAASPSPTTACRARCSPRRSSSTRARRRSSASASSKSASWCAKSAAQDAILVRPMAYVTLTIDHRVVDGHQTNAWLTPLRRDPGKLAGGLMAGKADDSSEHQFVRRVLIVLGLTALVLLAWHLRTLLLMIFGAVVVATIFRSARGQDLQGHRLVERRRHYPVDRPGPRCVAGTDRLVRNARFSAGADP